MNELLEIDHQAAHRALVERLKKETVPVRRLYSVRSRLMLWLLLDAALLLWIISHAARNYGTRLVHPAYGAELLLFLIAAILFAILGLRSAIPGRMERGVSASVALVAVIGAIVAIAVANPPVSSVPLGRFAAIGVNCAIGTTLLASLAWIGLWWMCRRAAPMRGALSGILIGAGAVCFAAMAMRIACPLDDPAHLLVWHILPALVLIGVSMLAGARWLRLRQGGMQALKR